MIRRLLILSVGMCLFASCNESFNSIYEEIEEQDPNVVPPEIVDGNKVNILPTLSDPLFSIDMTRAWTGPFGDFNEDKSHWFHTRFNIFGLLTKNDFGGSANYLAAQQEAEQRMPHESRTYGLLWNDTIGLSDQQGHTIFYERNEEDGHESPIIRKYKADGPLNRYKFFLLGTDGLKSDFRVESDKVLARLELDGSNDIMHSFAYHSDEEYSKAVLQLPSDETTKMFVDGGQNHLYNRLSGNRGVHPIFNVNHLMGRFDIRVKGGNPDLDNSCDFLKVFVTDVEIEAAKTIDVVVADDKWERDGYIAQFKNNQLFNPIGEPQMYPLTVVANELGNTPFTQSNRGDMDFDFLKAEADALAEKIGEDVIPKNSHWVDSSERDSLCKTVLLPPYPTQEGHFILRFKYRYVFMHYDAEDGKYHIGQSKNSINKSSLWEEFTETIEIPNIDNEGKKVEYGGGKRFTIVITVYGKSVVMVDVLQPTMWEDGGDVETGKDEIEI